MTRTSLNRLLLALGSGVALALAYSNFNLPILAWVALALLLIAVTGAGWRMVALCGCLHSFAFVLISMSWIYTVMRVHGPIDPLSSAGVLAAIAAAWSVVYGAMLVLVAWISRRSLGLACLAAPFLWVSVEFLRTHLPYIGFPWNLLGYTAATNLGLMQSSAWTGIWGLSLLVAGYNAFLAWVVLRPRGERRRPAWILGIATLGLLLIALVGPRIVPQATARHEARLVQLNFPEVQSYPPDWNTIHAAEMNDLERLSESVHKGEDLVVWPEVPAPFALNDVEFAARIQRIARTAQADFLVGVVNWQPTANAGVLPYNSAVLLDPAGQRVFVYDKIHLVPFGEYVPLRQWLTFASKLTAGIGDFAQGSAYKVGELSSGHTFGTYICFEAVFPDLVRRFAANGAQLFINISNDGWFGGTAAPAQHLLMARVRAVENRRWLLRDTNSGITVSVDPYGRVVARLAPDIRGALDAPYDFRTDTTLYTRWGDWMAWLSVIAAAALVNTATLRRYNEY